MPSRIVESIIGLMGLVSSEVFLFTNSGLITERGKPGASSVLKSTGQGVNYEVANAFTGNDEMWIPKEDQRPAAIWMHFPRAHRLVAIGYKNYAPVFDPNRVKVIGSNDCATWTTLLTVENTGFTKNKEFRKWDIPLENQHMFSCLGFMWESGSRASRSAVRVLDIRMWEAV